jgi:hypothetical protein
MNVAGESVDVDVPSERDATQFDSVLVVHSGSTMTAPPISPLAPKSQSGLLSALVPSPVQRSWLPAPPFAEAI